MNKYTLISKYGNREEVPFLIQNGREYISPHISRTEFGQKDGTFTVVIYDPLIELFETVRGMIGKPIVISSGYRSREYQQKLYDEDIRRYGRPSGNVAKPGSSPHETGTAMDLFIPIGLQAKLFAELFTAACVDLNIPLCRIGWKRYLGRGFIHVDLVPMLFKPYTKVPNPHSQYWKAGLIW